MKQERKFQLNFHSNTSNMGDIKKNSFTSHQTYQTILLREQDVSGSSSSSSSSSSNSSK